jgi:RNA polymerase sigma factor (sigma-70 family)
MNEEVFEEVYTRLFSSMVSYCWQRHSFLDCEAVVQDAFGIFWSKRESVKEDENPDGFLWMILKNRLRTKLRSSARDLKKMNSFKESSEQFESSEYKSGLEFLEHVKLTKKERELYDLVFVRGLTSDETSAILKISKTNTYQRIHRLRNSLKEQKKAFDDDDKNLTTPPLIADSTGQSVGSF